MRASIRSETKRAFRVLTANGWKAEEAALVLGLSKSTAYRYQAESLEKVSRVASDCRSLEALLADAD